jgi:hypothetical protein
LLFVLEELDEFRNGRLFDPESFLARMIGWLYAGWGCGASEWSKPG